MRLPALLPVLTLGLLTVSARAGDHPLVPGDPDDWRRFTVGDIEVVTNGSVDRAIDDLRSLRSLRDVLGSLLIEGTEERLAPMTLVLFDERDHFEPYQPWIDGRHLPLAGWFIPGFDRNTMVVDASRRRTALPVLYHEFVHAWFAANLPLLPPWLNEGFAEFYSTFERDGDRVRVGEPIRRHREALARRPFMGFPRMSSLGLDDPEYNESLRSSMFYAQSWALAHHLMTTRERRPGLTRFIEAVHRGVHPARALEESFGVGFEVIEAEMKGLKDRQRWPVFELEAKTHLEEDDVAVARLRPEETLVALGETIARLGNSRPGLAIAHFEAALAIDPTLARAHRGKALKARADGDLDAALASLDAALALEPDDPAANVDAGMILVAQWQDDQRLGPGSLGETPPRLATARAHFERALRALPDDPFARAGLGMSYLADRDPEPGIDAVVTARRELTWDPYLLATEIVLRANARDVAEARRLLDESLRRRRPDARTRAMIDAVEITVVNAEMLVVDRLAEEGDVDAANAIVERALETAGSPQLVRYLRERQAGLQRIRARGGP